MRTVIIGATTLSSDVSLLLFVGGEVDFPGRWRETAGKREGFGVPPFIVNHH